MPTLNCVAIVRWRVDPGPPPIVRYVDATHYPVYLPDNAAASDAQTLLGYVMAQPAADQPNLLRLVAQGLLTVTRVSSAQLALPALPP